MPILFRWLLAGSLARAGGTFVVLLAVYLIIETFDKARYLGKGLTGGLLGEYLVMKIPMLTAQFMPVIVLIAACLHLLDLSRHRELIAMRAAGLGVNKVLVPMTVMALVAAGLSLAIGEWVEPVTNKRLDVIERVHIHHKPPARHDVQWLKDGRRFFRLQPVAPSRFAVTIFEIDEAGHWRRRIDAASGRYENGAWQLSDVHVAVPSESRGMELAHLARLRVPAGAGPSTAEPPSPRQMNALELARYIAALKEAGLAHAEYVFTLHRKFAAPIACLIMVLLAGALAGRGSGRGMQASLGLIAAIAAGLVFYVLGNASGFLVGGDRLPPVFAAWLPDLVFGGFGLYLLLAREGY